ncbi:hypothetical protein DACRYDRAFT_112958 [Dacryopinax primogenitus]|uniref:Uncharacterized protein n=1 Tax=Dacryopinax primogenitus (strain DJM 731) TaxID=1858805 RepID=M5G7P5_DACPD|nr:uncharacterized protein DACRYDRAFT_112958 [Dacryopinax primogenitus]EJU06211.1 hypothetical protein DACRYDRAFT_112958 [Dacryopinax primogenitus]
MGSISEPFLLHSYAVPTTAGPSTCKWLPQVQAHARWGDVAEITVTVQGDGIHSYDRSSLHPVSSYTLGPSTYFHSAAASRAGKGGKRSTYVSVASGSDVAEGQKTAWVWPEGSEDTASKQSVELLHHAKEFLFATSLPSQIVIASPDGQLTLASSTLERIRNLAPPFSITGISWNFIFPKGPHTVGTTPENTHDAVILTFFGNEAGKFGVRVVRIISDELTDVGWEKLDEVKATDVMSVCCEAGGNACILLISGEILSFQISATSSVSCISPPSPIKISFPKSTSDMPQASLLHVASSHILVASTPAASRQVEIELWDKRYGVQLASYSMPVPTSTPEKFAVYLSQAASGQALLTLTCPIGGKKSDNKARSSVFIVPYTVPHVSTLLNALGRMQISDTQAAEVNAALSETQRGLIKSVGEALRNGASDTAQKAFFDWINLQTQATTNGNHVQIQPEDDSEEEGVNGLVDEDSDEEATLTNGREVNGTAHRPTATASLKKKALVHLPTALVEQLVDALLIPPKPSTDAHSSILRFLMRRGLVSYSMVRGEQSLVDILLDRGDWASVVVALQGVVDLPESAIVQVLLTGLKGDSKAIPLPNVLTAVLAAPVTRPALRLALREQLRDMNHVCRLLEVLQGWLEQSGLRGLELDREAGFVDVDFRPRPRIDSILSFAETLLDTYYISLLQHPPAQPILRSFSTLLEPQLSLALELERLRGPLEVFAKRKRAQGKSGMPQKSVSRFEEGRRRKKAQEEADMQVGLYRVEEVFF